MKAYGRSKLCNILFTGELARPLRGTGVTANCLHPGFVATRFADESGGLISRFAGLAKLLAISPEKGAETIFYLASSPAIAATTDAPDTICGRDGFTRDFGCGRYENLSGAFSWLTFFAGGAADVRRSRSDWGRELAEPTICSQRKPRSFRCSAQPAGSRGVRRINVWAVSCGGFRPLMMAVVMSGASQGRRRRE